MPEVEEILEQVDAALHSSPDLPAGGKRILITAGGTREPIDSVRYIGNMSTGRTAAKLCDALLLAGHEVTWLGAESAQRPGQQCNQHRYVSFADLQAGLKRLLAGQSWDVIIHAAAVSDYSVDRILQGTSVLTAGQSKLGSEDEITLHLKPNPKLLDQLRGWSKNPRVCIVGFKLTDTDDPALQQRAVLRLFERAAVDAVVHNDLRQIHQDSQAPDHPFTLYRAPESAEPCTDVAQLGKCLNRIILELTT
jgi:phosphopantothenoylcysteine decarboxylase/phosphopantothenate--cysteine ligase